MAEVVTSTGTSIAYESEGTGRPLVLVHGLTESSQAWDPVVPMLTDRYRVVRLDLPGHGPSGRAPSLDLAAMATEVADALATIGVDWPLLVGHSLGGIVVSALAGQMPTRGVINVDQSLQLDGFQGMVQSIEPALAGDEPTFRATMAAIFEQLEGPLDPGERTRLSQLRRGEQDLVLAIWDPVLHLPPDELRALVAEVAGGIDVPYLALHGTEMPDSYEPWLRRLIPTATVEVWPALGHYPHLAAPVRFAERVAEFDRTTS